VLLDYCSSSVGYQSVGGFPSAALLVAGGEERGLKEDGER
jgi:hypothetical protein